MMGCIAPKGASNLSIYDFQVKTMTGEWLDWSAYQGKVLLIVNTASQCGYSSQFAALQQLYETHHHQGFEILAFPCNQFNDKEPGSDAEVKAYCEQSFGVTFPLLSKLDVRGETAHPLFHYLVSEAPFRGFDTLTPNGKWLDQFLSEKYPELHAGDGIKWNFSKFLLDRSGQVSGRFEPTVQPLELEAAIRALL